MSQKLRALPVQLLEITGSVILKRGCTEFRVSGEEASEVLKRVLTITSAGNATCQEICEQFGLPKRQAVQVLLEQLVARHILVFSDDADFGTNDAESGLDIFYWHFNTSARKVTEELNTRHIVILGVNCISRQLVTSLVASDMVNVQVVDIPLLRNLRLFDEHERLEISKWTGPLPIAYQAWVDKAHQSTRDCLIATSDYGNHEVLREWNKFCVERHIHFLPVVLQDVIGYVGPFVVPGETACFECLRARQNAHFDDPEKERATEEVAYEAQSVIGFHPSMASILGDIAAFELTKFYSGVLPRWNVGSLIEVNLLATHLTVRKVLKVPRCLICSPLKAQSPVEAKKRVFSLGNRSAK
jgi:molybdopterin-synthase adenylyltransferase